MGGCSAQGSRQSTLAKACRRKSPPSPMGLDVSLSVFRVPWTSRLATIDAVFPQGRCNQCVVSTHYIRIFIFRLILARAPCTSWGKYGANLALFHAICTGAPGDVALGLFWNTLALGTAGFRVQRCLGMGKGQNRDGKGVPGNVRQSRSAVWCPESDSNRHGVATEGF